jgi:hypothetical protein
VSASKVTSSSQFCIPSSSLRPDSTLRCHRCRLSPSALPSPLSDQQPQRPPWAANSQVTGASSLAPHSHETSTGLELSASRNHHRLRTTSPSPRPRQSCSHQDSGPRCPCSFVVASLAGHWFPRPVSPAVKATRSSSRHHDARRPSCQPHGTEPTAE